MIDGRRGLDAFLGRLIRRYTAEVVAGDIEGLATMQARADELQAAVGLAAQQLTAPAIGYSWADVGRVLGVSRQTAHERYSGRRRRSGNVADAHDEVTQRELAGGESWAAAVVAGTVAPRRRDLLAG